MSNVPRPYEDAVRRTAARLAGRMTKRHENGVAPEANAYVLVTEMACLQELVGYVYRVDQSTVIDDFRDAFEPFEGMVPGVEVPDFILGR